MNPQYSYEYVLECFDVVQSPLLTGYMEMTISILASYPGHVGGGRNGLVSTVCACANDSGNLLRTNPIMDKLHVVVKRRNNQTRYTACSVAAVFTRR